ncbi:uncharacterized protein [Diadema setosum]|uniref:uncharacterized protein n=1 Tax=Diadema setosum TaxID=31175 RepID=UPI003B3BA3A7
MLPFPSYHRSGLLSRDSEEASSSAVNIPTIASPKETLFEPIQASTPRTRKALLPSFSGRVRQPMVLADTDSDTDYLPSRPQQQTYPEYEAIASETSSVVEDKILEGLDLHVFDHELGANEDVSDDEDDGKEAEEMAMINEKKCIVFEGKLLELVKTVYGTTCPKCEQPFAYRTVQKGTAIIIIWECARKHGSSWTSQPRYKGVFAGNLQVSSCIVMSGNSYQKIATMAKFMSLRMLSRTTFDRIQRLYIAPAVKKFYEHKQEELLATYDGPVVVSGDGRSDSPGHSSTFCTYSFCDEQTSRILHTNTVMMQEAAGKSPNMERIAFTRGLDFLMTRVEVESVVTDAHPQIAATMKRTAKYQSVKHQWDLWHGSKNLVKKLSAAAQQKNCAALQPWIRKISNHFWHSSQTCEGDSEKLAGNFAGVLHHVVNEHEWLFTVDGRAGECDHEPLEDATTPWLSPGSPPHQKLKEIIMDKRFLKSLPYYTDFRHTGNLESFHATLLMYATKRSYFHPVGYTTRVLLAVLDVNHHADRKQAKTEDGRLRWGKRWNKRTKQFTVFPIKEPKTYLYIPQLMLEVFRMRAKTLGHLSQHVSLAEDDPRRIHPTIAMQPSLPTAELVKEHQSRFT